MFLMELELLLLLLLILLKCICDGQNYKSFSDLEIICESL